MKVRGEGFTMGVGADWPPPPHDFSRLPLATFVIKMNAALRRLGLSREQRRRE
jgi:hypothetical protein